MSAFEQIKKLFPPILFVLTLNHCAIGGYPDGALHQLTAQPLSLNSSALRTCVFDPHYSILHFPMSHTPPSKGHYTPQIWTEVVLSQFQLLHTILAYNRSRQRQLLLFDENIVSDSYNESFFQALRAGQAPHASYTKLNGDVFYMEERMRTAQNFFTGGIPRYYEHLSQPQREFLFHTGASITLYLLGEIPKIYKVISPEKYALLKANLQTTAGHIQIEGNSYWVFTFRELELRQEALRVFQQNPGFGRVILIAYGSAHDFSDEFTGYPFQSGHNFCLTWRNDPSLNPRLP